MIILALILRLLQPHPTIEVKFEVDDTGVEITDNFEFTVTT